MLRRISILLCLLILSLTVFAQTDHPAYHKMSGWVRDIVRQEITSKQGRGEIMSASRAAHHSAKKLVAFVRVEGSGDDILCQYGGRVLTQMDDICIAEIPLDKLTTLSADRRVSRIEAHQSGKVMMDTTALVINALPVYAGDNLPMAYTGKGVVVGLQDIGFDLTHPTFYDSTGSNYRIRRFWDMISADTIGSVMPVGAEYTTEETILAYGSSRDAHLSSHGTHTAGTAAGSGFDTPYRGMAFDSDLCLVSNAVSTDLPLISEDDLYRYTYATDALGFKYIFDYADAVGKPCVVSFSEGAPQDFRGDDVLYYEMLEKLVGPGHILVAAAGNEGLENNYLHKSKTTASEGAFIRTLGGNRFGFTVRGDGQYALRLTARHPDATVEQAVITPEQILAMPDSLLTDTLRFSHVPYFLKMAAYRSCYDEQDLVIEGLITTVNKMPASEGSTDSVSVRLGYVEFLTLELEGTNNDVELFATSGYMFGDATLNGGERSHNIHSPGAAPCVICVGANTQRNGFVNQFGNYMTQEPGYLGPGHGARSLYSSTGPTFDGRMKPEVTAPGTNIIASFSSFTPETALNPLNFTRFSDFLGRTYPWGANSGTSMSTPVVAGAIALWLQANPKLTPDDVKGVLERTCRHPSDIDYPNNQEGFGEIDVYRGLLDVLSFTGIDEISTTQPGKVRFSMLNDGRLRLHFDQPLTTETSFRIYSIGGIQVVSGVIPAGQDQAFIDLSTLPRAVYAVQINSSESGITGSTLIRVP